MGSASEETVASLAERGSDPGRGELPRHQFSLLGLLLLTLGVPVSVSWVPSLPLPIVAEIAAGGLVLNVMIEIWVGSAIPEHLRGQRVAGALLGFSTGFLLAIPLYVAVLLLANFLPPRSMSSESLLWGWKCMSGVCGCAGYAFPVAALRWRRLVWDPFILFGGLGR